MLAVPLTNVKPKGRMSLTNTLVAVSGPLLTTVIVNASAAPGATELGAESVKLKSALTVVLGTMTVTVAVSTAPRSSVMV